MLDWHGSGMSVMEMSHRGKEFISIAAGGRGPAARAAGMPANYKVLFMQGGAIGENAIVPMNLLRGKTRHRLRRHRRVVEEVDQGSEEVRHRQRGGQCRRHRLHRVPDRAGLEARPQRGLRAHLRQRDHRRRRVLLHPDTGRRAAGGRHVEQHPVAPGGRGEVRPDLRRRAEEHRPGRA
jgi:hypothetical protein